MMKRLWLLIICALLPLSLVAQQYAEYNRRGDDAMQRKDYRDARMWYEEGVEYCDDYSIGQLTLIWLENEDMQRSMHSLMTKCLNCLTIKGNANDTIAINLLIDYYEEGIGTTKNTELSRHWQEQLESLRNPVPMYAVSPVTISTPREPMKFFAGYAFSPESPFGITVGGIWDRVGWYARFKTNFSFDGHAYECDNASNMSPLPVNASTQYNSAKKMKTNSYMATAGVVYKATSWLYASVGAGYGERVLLCPFITTDYDTGATKEVWCYNIDSSYKGVSLEADLMFRYDRYFVSVGCNTLNFEYVDLNAGIGLFF